MYHQIIVRLVPIYDSNKKEGDIFECYKQLDGYYLDKTNTQFYFKECYSVCQKCDTGGNNKFHKCIECKFNYNFEIEFDFFKNCYEKCNINEYYYIDNDNQMNCTGTLACPSEYSKLIKEKGECVKECNSKYKYEYMNECFENCPEGTKASESTICIKLYEYNNSYYEECPLVTKSDHEDKICYDECPAIKFEYNNTCYSNCPNNTYSFYIKRKECLEELLENFYLDENDNIYKVCYENCKNCYGKGDEINNNCKECINGFILLHEPNKDNNCFNCLNYYYIDDSNNLFCTEDVNCPKMHKKFISEKKNI